MKGVRKVLVHLAEEVSPDSIDQLIYARVLVLPSKALPIIGSGNIDCVKKCSKSSWYYINWGTVISYPEYF